MTVNRDGDGFITFEEFVPLGQELVDRGVKLAEIKRHLVKQLGEEINHLYTFEQLEQLKNIFHFMDKDGNGRIDEDELLGT